MVYKDKEKQKAHAAKYREEHREELNEKSKQWYQINKERLQEVRKRYRDNNKEKINEHLKVYYINNKDKIKKRQQTFREKNRTEINRKRRVWVSENKEKCKNRDKKWRNENKDKISKAERKRYFKNKKNRLEAIKIRDLEDHKKIFDILGNKCVSCGETNLNFLTLDHIHNDGYLDKTKNGSSLTKTFIRKYRKSGWPIEEIKQKFQILCYNCNSAKVKRDYFDLPYEEQSYGQRYRFKLWKEAFYFFGPCQICGCSNLKFLSIDHIHNDGAKKRKNGEKVGAGLLSVFKKQGWPESLKEDYRLLCFNCNCNKEYNKNR